MVFDKLICGLFAQNVVQNAPIVVLLTPLFAFNVVSKLPYQAVLSVYVCSLLQVSGKYAFALESDGLVVNFLGR